MSDYWLALLIRALLIIVVLISTLAMLDVFEIDKLNFIIGMLIAQAIQVKEKI